MRSHVLFESSSCSRAAAALLGALAVAGCAPAAEPPTEEVDALESPWVIRPSGPSGDTAVVLSAPPSVRLADFLLAPRVAVKHYDLDENGEYALVGRLAAPPPFASSFPHSFLHFPVGSVPVQEGHETVVELGALRISGGGLARIPSIVHRVGSWNAPEVYDRTKSAAESRGEIVLEPTPFSLTVRRDGVALGCLGDSSPFARDALLSKHCPAILTGKAFPALGRYEIVATTRDRTGKRVTHTQTVDVAAGAEVSYAIPGAVKSTVTSLPAKAEVTSSSRMVHAPSFSLSCVAPAPYSADYVRPRGSTFYGDPSIDVWALRGERYPCELTVGGSVVDLEIVGGTNALLPLRLIEVVDPLVGGAPRRGTFTAWQWRSGAWLPIASDRETGTALHVVPGKYRVEVSYVSDFGRTTTLPAYESDLSQ